MTQRANHSGFERLVRAVMLDGVDDLQQNEEDMWIHFEWNTGKRRGEQWRPYGLRNQKLLRMAWQQGQRYVQLQVSGYRYTVDLCRAGPTQTAQHSGFERLVRVVTA